ncbi:IS3 family transposase [Shewanella sp. D64]|uniref:IS3 family transposase n=1 Tax=unclassified Shewanella TaxID=196818 RepID=UPI0022BA38AF|nr:MULTISPECIES: IS3 family transposase [unclassified Shewanella]MEC4728888.1 IS3 family transposase [Shewanella sp. D64]MEC4740762.1 IS3 family transposase [Shewanella sp. E94]WBJ94496.1 IS3 family transposase [Shewanella sp. MTB7]
MKIITRKIHTAAFKLAAVQQSLNSPDTVKALAGKLGIHPALLSKWRAQLTSKKHVSKPIKNIGPNKGLAELERENRELKKRLEHAELENDNLKKGEGVLRQTSGVKFSFIQGYSSVRRTIKILCEILSVSRSGYYSWLEREPSKRDVENKKLSTFLKEQIGKHKGIAGYRKLWLDAVANGFDCNKKRVQRLLQVFGYRSKACKRKFGVVKPKLVETRAPNYLNRQFDVTKPNTVWVSDITQIRCKEGWQYLCVIIDLYSRKVVSWATSYINSSELVMKSLKQAWGERSPNRSELMFHSDQGAQYRSFEVLKWLTKRRVTVSMSRKGNCWDNACSESFFAQLKKEWFSNLEELSRKEMTIQCRFYIDDYYNMLRRHGTLDGVSPIAFESRI